MAIPHAISGQPVDVHPLGTELSSAQSIALFKSQDIEVMRVVLLAGKSMKEHKLDIERALFLNNARVAGSSVVARELAGAPAWLVTNLEFEAAESCKAGDVLQWFSRGSASERLTKSTCCLLREALVKGDFGE